MAKGSIDKDKEMARIKGKAKKGGKKTATQIVKQQNYGHTMPTLRPFTDSLVTPASKGKGGVKMGRPPKFESVFDLQEAIIAYFKSCIDYKEIPNKAGLAFYLGVSRDTLNAWENGERNETVIVAGTGEEAVIDFSDTIKRTYDHIENYWVQLLGRFGGSGPIFYLVNAFKYKDVKKVELELPEPPAEKKKKIDKAFESLTPKK